MSNFTVDKLYDMWEEHKQIDQKTADPVGNFIARNALRLGFRDTEQGRYLSKYF